MNFNNTHASAAAGQNFHWGGSPSAVAQQSWPVYHGAEAQNMHGQVCMCVGVLQGHIVPQPYGDGAMVPVQCITPSFGQVSYWSPTNRGMDQTPSSSRSIPSLVLVPVEHNPWEEHGSGFRTPSISPRFSPTVRQSGSGATSNHSRTSSEIGSPPPASALTPMETMPPAQATDDVDWENLTEEEFDTLLTHLDGLDPVDRRSAVFQLQALGLVWRLASSPTGSRFVQEVLDEEDENTAGPALARVAAGLRGHVNEAWESLAAAPHANHVLQKCIQVLPPSMCSFVLEEMLSGSIERASCSKYGCRIVQRLIEHFTAKDVEPLIREILEPETTLKLMVSRFGNFVVQCVLEHGSEEQRTRVAAALFDTDDAKFTRLAENMYASHVVQQAMKHCRDEVRRSIIERIAHIERVDPRFKRSVYGSFVVHEAKKWLRAYGESMAHARAVPRARRGGRGGRGRQDGNGAGLPQQRPRTAAAPIQEVPAQPAHMPAAHRGRPIVRASVAPGVWA